MKKTFLILNLLIITTVLFGQDLKKVGKVPFNKRFMVISDDNQYVASVKDNAIVHIASGEKFTTDFQFIKFIPNENKYIGYKKEDKMFVEVSIQQGTIDTLFKLEQTFMIRNSKLKVKISPDGKYVGIKGISTRTGRMKHAVLLLDREKKTAIKELFIPKGYYTFAFSNDSQKVIYLDLKKQNGATQHFVKEYQIEQDEVSETELYGINMGMEIGNELMHITYKNQLIFTLAESGDNVYLSKYDFEYEELELSESFSQTQLKTNLASVGFDKEKNHMIRIGYRLYTFDLETLELIEEEKLKYKIANGVSIDGTFILVAKDRGSETSIILSRKSK